MFPRLKTPEASQGEGAKEHIQHEALAAQENARHKSTRVRTKREAREDVGHEAF